MQSTTHRNRSNVERDLESIGLDRGHMIPTAGSDVAYSYFGRKQPVLSGVGRRGLQFRYEDRDASSHRVLLYQRPDRSWLMVVVITEHIGTFVVGDNYFPSAVERKRMQVLVPLPSTRRREAA